VKANQVAFVRCVTGVCTAGNDKLHLLTSERRQRLRVDLADWDGSTRYAEYDNFEVGSEAEKYRLRLRSRGGYTGTAGIVLL